MKIDLIWLAFASLVLLYIAVKSKDYKIVYPIIILISIIWIMFLAYYLGKLIG